MKYALFLAICLSTTLVWAGRLPGPGKATGILAPGESHSKSATFGAHTFASVKVTGEGGDIACYLLKDGVIIDVDDDDMNFCLLSWLPKEKGNYIIRIANHGSGDSKYVLETS